MKSYNNLIRQIIFSVIALFISYSSSYANGFKIYFGNRLDTTIVSGRILNESGNPLMGANVRIKDQNRGTITDSQGSFSLPVKQGDYLIISNIGYKTRQLIYEGKNNMAIVLQPDINQLEGVTVSTGYQQIPKERATGSFEEINNATLNQQTGSNIIQRIDGVATSVLFPKQSLQDGPEFMIRGFSTINGPKSPLIVVDNFPYNGDINNINPNDVESITILKDAAAASIWGTKAGNGVIVITTKKGKFNQPLKVQFNSNISITGKPSLSSLRLISSNDYINVEQQLFNQGFYDPYLSDTYSYPAVSPVVDILNKEKNGLLSASEASQQINNYRKINIADQYSKYDYREAVSQQYALDLQGGAKNTSYYLSIGYDKSLDYLSAQSDRLAIRAKNDYKPVKNLQISLSMQYTNSNDFSGKPDFGGTLVGNWQLPYIGFTDANGKPLSLAINYNEAYLDTAGDGKLLDWHYNPMSDYLHNTTKNTRQDLLTNVGIKYTILKGLSVDIKYLYERQIENSKNLEDTQSFAARDLINSFSQINPNTGLVTYIVPLGNIVNLSQSVEESQNVRGQINYQNSWGTSEVAAIAGGEIRQTSTNGNGNTYYGYDDNTLTYSEVDFMNSYPTFVTGSYNSVPGQGSFTGLLNRYVSFYANGSYTYKSKYIFSASGRRDASNLFGVATNHQWNPLWSAGAAWNISKESFYHADWLPFLKFRATYGYSGNTNPSMSAVTVLVLNGPIPPTNLPSARVNQFPNPELRWEKVRMINVGMDFGLKNEIITGTIEGYFKKGLDLFGDAPFDPTAGLDNRSTLIRNVADMKGSGIDATVNTNNINGTFRWRSTVLFSYNTDETTKYYVNQNLSSSSYINTGYAINPLVGKPLYSIVAYRWAGLDANGNPQGYVGKDISTDYATITQNTPIEDLIYKASLPKYFGSFINSFSWKGFSLIANISYRLGYYFMKPSINYSVLFNNGASAGSSDYGKRWQKAGDEKVTNVPAMIYPADNNRDIFYNYSEALIEKAGNFKLQYVDFAYDFRALMRRSYTVQSLQLYINANNLGIIWRANKDHIDPDYISTITPGKTFVVGIRATF